MAEGARYIIGIDLGTTHIVVSYIDTTLPKLPIKLFQIPQLTENGVWERRDTLAACLYMEKEILVGHLAKEEGAKVPTRLIHSAKSWLCHTGVGRRDKILPVEAADEKNRLSPIEATTHFLKHIAAGWEKEMGCGLEEQEIILTIPASFDEMARNLTLEAARAAGFTHLTLLEEPQAAFYHWLSLHEKGGMKPGETILVCDVGGGTTDFSLIEVKEDLSFQRMAVGDHLLLGGDNLDIALCYLVDPQGELTRSQWHSLRHQMREAKEKLLSGVTSEFPLWIPGVGGSLIEGGVHKTLDSNTIQTFLLEGFFGLYPFEEAKKLPLKGGVRNMGLPYEKEPSITKHLAYFLSSHQVQQKPTYLLFNGGSLKPSCFQERLATSLDLWYVDQKPVQALSTGTLDLAVAKGAAYYGKARLGQGIRIKAGGGRGYYLEIEVKNQGMEKRGITLVPRGASEGARYLSDKLFFLLPNTPVSFSLYHSHTRLHDEPGSFVLLDSHDFSPLPPIQTLLHYGIRHTTPIPVRLEAHYLEIGILEIWLQSVSSSHRWKLEFQVTKRDLPDQTATRDETFDAQFLDKAKEKLTELFSLSMDKLKSIMPDLEKELALKRTEWPLSILRGLFDTLLKQEAKRSLSSSHEERFWHLMGYFLRPGRGYALDDFRLKAFWKIILGELKKKRSEEINIQKWICYRRLAAGLNKGQQAQLWAEIFPLVYDKKKQELIPKGKQNPYAYSEKLRLLAALEGLDIPSKEKLGSAILRRILEGKGETVEYWALGRIGARILLYAPLNQVMPKKVCEEWVDQLLRVPAAHSPYLPLLLTLLARQTDHLEINLEKALIDRVSLRLKQVEAVHYEELLRHERDFNLKERELFFGDSLPVGLRFEE